MLQLPHLTMLFWLNFSKMQEDRLQNQTIQVPYTTENYNQSDPS